MSQSSPTADTHVELEAKSRRGLEIACRKALGESILPDSVNHANTYHEATEQLW